jgi:hypothetical protein
VAKVSLLRQGIRVSFGSARMTTSLRRAYRTGYALMLLALFATLVLAKVLSALKGAAQCR